MAEGKCVLNGGGKKDGDALSGGGKEEVIVCRPIPMCFTVYKLTKVDKGDIVVVTRSSNKADTRFDEIIGCIQDILLDEEFSLMQMEFLEKHYQQFEETEENKFIYTSIFKQYTELIESYLNEALKSKIPDFVMEKFLKTLESRKDEVGEEIMDMLLSFSDFLTFKQTFLDYKAMKEGQSLDLGGLVVNSLSGGQGGGGGGR